MGKVAQLVVTVRRAFLLFVILVARSVLAEQLHHLAGTRFTRLLRLAHLQYHNHGPIRRNVDCYTADAS